MLIKGVMAIVASPLPQQTLYVDGTTNMRGSRIETVIISLEHITIKKSLRLDFLATNNEVQYEALITVLDSIKKLEGESIKVFCDSRLVVGQVRGEFEAKDQRMWWSLGQVKQLQASFGTFTISQVSRSKNTHANSLATLHTSIGESLPRIIIVESLSTSSHDNKTPIPVSVVHIEPSWMDLVVSFIKKWNTSQRQSRS